jgi:hypothetical protein
MNKEILEKVSYQFFVENRYTITDFNLFDHEYSAICNNGFIKIYTNKGKAYWLAQNELGHLTPDWKLHVSVNHLDVPNAWNLVSEIFLRNKCKSGMKVAYLKENSGIKTGREITIYIYKYDIKYSEESEIGKEYILKESDEHNDNFWLKIIKEIEQTLELNKIRSNGTAEGDLKIGKYVSLRNEAFVYCSERGVDVYPPDYRGWNAANHLTPTFMSNKKNYGIVKVFLITFFGFIISFILRHILYN